MHFLAALLKKGMILSGNIITMVMMGFIHSIQEA
jgi:hypothetical protein